MKKTTINFVINILMMLCMSALVGIGFLIKFNLISGQESWLKYGENYHLIMLGMNRHEWGTVHLVIGLAFLVLLLFHVILHWKSISCMCSKIFNRKSIRQLVVSVFILICVLLMAFPFFMNPVIGKAEHRNKKHSVVYSKQASNKIFLNRGCQKTK